MSFVSKFPKRVIGYQAIALFLFTLAWSSVHAELVLTSPPRESAANGLKQYGPIAEKLTQVLGEKVTYQHPKGWLYYQRDMRKDKYDIIFDGPHFVSWRIKKFDHTPVAKLPGKLSFVLITEKGMTGLKDLEINRPYDLVNLPVCALAPPNLATLSILAAYDNPVRQPRLMTVKGGMKGVYNAFKSGKCKAAILRDKFYEKKIPENEREKLKVLFKSDPVTSQGITVSSRVNEDQRKLIAGALTEITTATAPTLKRFAPKAEKMVITDNSEYEGYYKLLTGVIFGWEIDEDKPAQ